MTLAGRRVDPVAGAAMALVAVAAVVWVPSLWHSSAPGSALPSVSARAYFSARQLARGASYTTVAELLTVGGQVVLIAVLVLYARRGAGWMRESAAGRIGTGFLLGMIGFAFVWLAELPFGVAGLWWARDHHLSKVGYVDYVVSEFLGLGGRFLFVCLALLIAMGFAGLTRRHWWIPAAAVFVGLAALQTFLTPYLVGDLKTLHDPALRAQAHAIARAEGVGSVPVYVQDVHEATTQPNAESAGLGSSRRVILWDTLFDGRFTPAEVDAVLAHEYGHLAHGHLGKRIGWDALLALPTALLIALVTRRRGGLYEPAAVPLALVAFVAVNLALTPVHNLISQRMEAEADWSSLQTTRAPAVSRSLFVGLAVVSHDDPRASWSDLFLADHPPIDERIAQTLLWERLHPRAVPAPGAS